MFDYENYYKVYNARAAENYYDEEEKLKRLLEGNKPPKGVRETVYLFLRHEAELNWSISWMPITLWARRQLSWRRIRNAYIRTWKRMAIKKAISTQPIWLPYLEVSVGLYCVRWRRSSGKTLNMRIGIVDLPCTGITGYFLMSGNDFGRGT